MSATLEEVAERETGVAVEEADTERVRSVLDARAHAELGMSADDFLEALRYGKFEDRDEPAIHRLIAISRLLD